MTPSMSTRLRERVGSMRFARKSSTLNSSADVRCGATALRLEDITMHTVQCLEQATCGHNRKAAMDCHTTKGPTS